MFISKTDSTAPVNSTNQPPPPFHSPYPTLAYLYPSLSATPITTASNRSTSSLISALRCALLASIARNSPSSTRIRSSCCASPLPKPGSTDTRCSICAPLSTRSCASSRCAAANVDGLSGCSGRGFEAEVSSGPGCRLVLLLAVVEGGSV